MEKFLYPHKGDCRPLCKTCPVLKSNRYTKFLERQKNENTPTTNLLGKLKRLGRHKAQEPPLRKKHLADIVHMPREVMIRIVANLSKQEQISLRNTCTKFRKMATTEYRHLYFRMICNMDYLFKISCRFPYFGLCDCCFRLHPCDQTDTPHSPKRPICALPHVDANEESAVSGTHPYTLSYRHVQLYLKLVRRGGSGTYTESLMKLHKATHEVKNCRMECHVDTVFQPVPLIRAARFLQRRVVLFRPWCYRPAKVTEPVPYWDMEICPHQQYSENKLEAFEWEDMEVSGKSSGPSFKVLSPERHKYALCKAVQRALASPNVHTFGACTFCHTDFSVKVIPVSILEKGFPLDTNSDGVYRLIVNTWQDLGGECPPLIPTRASHSHLLHEHVYSSDFRNYKPGSAWELYEEEFKRHHRRTGTEIAEGKRLHAMYKRIAESGQRHHPEVFQLGDDKGSLMKKFKKKQYL